MIKVMRQYTYGWDDLSDDPEMLELFPTRELAQASIDELIEDTAEAVRMGNMEHPDNPDDYMLQEVKMKPESERTAIRRKAILHHVHVSCPYMDFNWLWDRMAEADGDDDYGWPEGWPCEPKEEMEWMCNTFDKVQDTYGLLIDVSGIDAACGTTQSGMELEKHEPLIAGFLGSYFNDAHDVILHADTEEQIIRLIREKVKEAQPCDPE